MSRQMTSWHLHRLNVADCDILVFVERCRHNSLMLMLLWLVEGCDKGDGDVPAECSCAAVWSRLSNWRQTWLLQSLTERFVLNIE